MNKLLAIGISYEYIVQSIDGAAKQWLPELKQLDHAQAPSGGCKQKHLVLSLSLLF